MKNIAKTYKKVAALLTASMGMAGSIIIPVSNIGIAVAAEQDNQEMGTVNINVRYDHDIIPEDGDEFVITYCVKDDEFNTAEITLDASQIYEDGGEIQIPYNSYTILNIEYKGDNDQIKLQGYGINTGFHCEKGIDGSFTIAIGDEVISSFERDYGAGNVKVKDAYHNEWGTVSRDVLEEKVGNQEALPLTMDEYEADQERKADETVIDESDFDSNITVGDTAPAEVQDNHDDDINIRPNNNGDAKVETYLDDNKENKDDKSDKKTDRKKDALYKLIGLVAFAAVGFIVMFVVHKKGII